MEDVEGLIHVVSRLLDAGELEHVFEHVFAILDIFPLIGEGASLFDVALTASSRTPLILV
jgi:hypothetical protein